MNKTEFVKAIATETGFTQKDVKAVLEAAQTVAYDAMAKEEEVKVFDGLTLVGQHKDATTARNPMTGDTVDVPAKTVPKARFGAVAKRIVNGEE
jgi:DNA-binding protein HU-beta